jgi:transposase
MFGLGGNQRIYYCPHPVNLRKSFDGLAGAVHQYIGRDPASGHLFVFFSRNKKLVKMIFYQDGGMCLFAKRLERGQFNPPVSAEGKIELEPRELYAVLAGIKPKRYYKRYSKPATGQENSQKISIWSDY